MAILDEHGNHISLPGTHLERMIEVMVRTAEQVLARMYTEIPMSKLDEEASALLKLTEAYLCLNNHAFAIENAQDIESQLTQMSAQLESLQQRVDELAARIK